MTRPSTEPVEEAADGRRSESGDTLVEILLALVIIGIAAGALLFAFASAITNSSVHRQLVTFNTNARAATSEIIGQVQASQDDVFGACPSTYSPSWPLTGGFTASAYSYQYWNGTTWVPGSSYTAHGAGWTLVSSNPANCTSYGPQLWTVTVTSNSAKNPYTQSVDTVVYDPNAPAVSAGTKPNELVFLSPTAVNPGTGTVGAPLTPQPLVAVEQSGQIVYNDASSVSLQILTKPAGGTLSSSCSAVENDGIFSFGDCSLSTVGSYTLEAVDTDGLSTTTQASYTISAAPAAQLVFTTSSVSGIAGQSAALGKITVQQQDYQGNPVNAGAAGTTVDLSSNSPGTFIFNTTQGATSPTGATSVLIPSGSSSVTFYYGDTKSGTPVIQATSSGLLGTSQSETVTAGAAAKVAITPTPASAGASNKTNISLGFQLTDAFGNNTASTGTTNLTVSSASAKGFFNANSGGTGTLGTAATVSFANGVGAATEWYGDEAASASTAITAKNGAATWGSTTVTITAATTGDTMTIVQGSGQSASISTAFATALEVQDVDAFNNPVPNVTVTFTAPGTGASGTFASTSTATATAVTNAAGQATVSTFTANTKAGGPYNVTTAATGVAAPPTFTETNLPGTPAKVAITPAPASAGASSTTNIKLSFQLEDQYGNNVTSVGTTNLTVSSASAKGFFNANSGGTGTLGTAATVSFANGVGTATEWYGDEAASASTAITAKNGTNTWGSTTVTITAATTGDTMTIVQGSGQSATVNTAFATGLEVQDVDAFNNPVPNVTVTFTAPGTGASGTFASTSTATATAVTNAAGQATVSTFTANTKSGGPYNVTTAATGVAAPPTFTETNLAGTPTKVVVTPTPASATASGTTNISLGFQLEDQYNNNAISVGTTNLTVSSASAKGFFNANSGGTGTLGTAATVSFANGVGTATEWYGDEAASASTAITAKNGTATWGSTTVTINAGAPGLVVVTPTPATATASGTTNIKLSFQLVDQFGNNTTSVGTTSLTVSSASAKGFFNANSGGTGTLGTAATVSFANGVGTATEWYGDEAASASTAITAKNGTNTWGSTTVTITAATTGDTMTIVQGSGQSATVNTAFATGLEVQDVDAFNNPVPNVTVTFTAPGTGASGTFASTSTATATAVTNAAGQATVSTFTANTKSGGPYNVTTAATGVAAPPTFTETNLAGTPTKVVVTPTPASATASGTTNISLGFQLEDQYNNNAISAGTTNLTVSSASAKGFFNANSGGTGTLGTAATVSFANGVGTATEWYGDEAASASTAITAKNGTATWGSTTVTITAATTGDTMTIVQGSGQSATVNTAFATGLEVQDVDAFNNPVPNVTVTFTAPGTGASGTFASTSTATATAVTNAAGQATVSTFTANTKSGGPYNVTTAATGVAAPPTFTETNKAGTPTQVVVTPTPASATASGTTNISLGFQLIDQYGNNAISAGTTNLTVSSASAKGFFNANSGGTGTLGTAATVSFANGVGTATEWYGDEAASASTAITAKNGTNTWGSTTVTINAGAPGLVVVTPTPATATASGTTNISLGFQLVDQFGNNTTSVGTTSLTVSSASAKGFFNANSGGTGTLGTAATVSFANGVGTATEWYGDEAASASTAITAKNGTNTWGSTTVTITAATTGDTMTIVQGSGQSATVNTAFATGLEVQDVDAFNNPVPNVTVTFTAPGTGASGTFASTSTATATAVTNAAGQATVSTFTANTKSGGPYNVTTAATGVAAPPTFTETNLAGTPTKVVVTPTPASATASGTTNISLGFQLEDQYNNNAISAGTTNLTVSSASAKGFFNANSGGTGTLGTAATVSFANGVGTATEWYGDEAASASTAITAKNGTNTWGSTTVTITAATTGDTMTIVQGSGQSATVNTAFATGLEVQDVDAFNNPVPNVTVTFTAPGTGASGTFASTSTATATAVTNAAGQATVSTFTANTKSGGPYNVTTAATGVAAPPTFTETNKAGTPTQVVVTPTPASATASGTTNISLGFQLIDQYGNNAISAGTTSLTVSSASAKGFFNANSGGTGTLGTAATVSFANGVGTATEWYGDEAASASTAITAKNGTATWGSTTVTINAGAPGLVVVTPTPATATASGTTNISLGFQLVDQFGNNTTSVGTTSLTVSSASAKGFFNANSGGTGTLGTAATVSFANGVGTATEWYGDEAASASTAITAKNGTNTWGSTTVTITAATTGDTMTIVQGSGQSATVNTAFATGLEVQDVDAFNNPVPNVTVTFTAPGTGASGTFASTSTATATAVTNAAGQATVSTFTANTKSGGPYNVTTAATGVAAPPTFTETNLAGTPTKVVVTPTPASATASGTTNISLGFQLEDQYNNNAISAGTTNLTVSSASAKGFFNANSGGTGTLGTAATVSFANGVGTATEWYGDEAASASTAITAKNGTNTWGSTTVTITAATTGDTMTIVQGSGQSATVNTAFATGLEVQDVDAFNNPVPNVTVTFTAPGTGASGTFASTSTATATAVTNAAGQATVSTFTANTKSGGPYNVTTAATGVAAPPTFTETNKAGTPTQVVVTPTPASATASGTTNISLGFQLIDQYGNNAISAGTTSLTVSSASAKGFFNANSGGTGTLGTAATVSFANGVGTATEWYGDEAASASTAITAKNGTNTWGSTTVTINAQTTGDTMTIVQGSPQATQINSSYPTALEVLDVDQYGNPVPNVTVTFTAPGTGASGTFASTSTATATAVTNAAGQATASTFTANGTSGHFTVTTAASGVASPPGFSLDNTHVTVTNVTSKTGATNPVTTNQFSMTSGTMYLVTAFASRNGTLTSPPTLTITGTPTQAVITESLSGDGNCNDTSTCDLWAWTFTANTTSTTATVSVNFGNGHTPAGAVLDVMSLAGASSSTPVHSSTASGCNNRNCNNDTETVTADLSTAPVSGDITLQILGSDDQIGATASALPWSPTNSNVFFNSATSESLDVNVASPGQQNQTTSTSGTGYTGSKDWGTIALEIGAS